MASISISIKSLARAFDVFLDRAALAALYFSSVLLAIMIAIMVAQVVLRYGFSNSLLWAEEVVRFLMIWISLFAATVALWRRQHIAVDVLTTRLPERIQRVLGTVVELVTIAFVVTLSACGWTYLEVVEVTRSPALGITMNWIYLAVPISMGFMGIMALRSLMSVLGVLPKPESHVTGDRHQH